MSTQGNLLVIKLLTYLMFMMFALTTESVGLIIPEVMRRFHLGLTESGAFHYAPMAAIALSGAGLGFLADRLGRKKAIMLGLALFGGNAFLFLLANQFLIFLLLLSLTGVAIGIFKTGALALIGDIARNPRDHTSIMNMTEGFFGVGSIIGPAIVARLLQRGLDWQWLYAIAGMVCLLLLLLAACVRYPRPNPATALVRATTRSDLLRQTLLQAFSLACFLYVALECSIYVWLPTYLQSDPGLDPSLILWAVPVFFALRAGGRFLGAFLLKFVPWAGLLLLFSSAILVCFLAAIAGGAAVALWSLPASGLFMSVIYPTLNSKGISCFAKRDHGTVAGILLFFTCLGAALGPLAMGAASDLFGDTRYCFVLAGLFAALLTAGLFYNWLAHPTRARLRQMEELDYDGANARS